MIIRILSEETKRKRTETFNRKRDEKALKEIGNLYWNFTVESINEELTEKYNSNGMRRGVYFNFRCICGKLIPHRLSDVKNGHCKSCGCIKFNNPNRIEDLSGKEFGRLTVIKRDIERDSKQYKQGEKSSPLVMQMQMWKSENTKCYRISIEKWTYSIMWLLCIRTNCKSQQNIFYKTKFNY